MNDNPLLKTENKEPEQKIGFQTATPLKKGVKVEKFQDKLPGKKLRVFTKLCTIFGIIFSSLTMMYFLLPFFAIVIGALLALCISLFMIFSVVCTLGIALLIEDYRYWIGNHMFDVPNFFFDIADNINKLVPYFFVVAGPALAFTIAGLVLSIIGKAKNYKFFTSYVVLNSIFLFFTILFVVLYIVAGGPVHTSR